MSISRLSCSSNADNEDDDNDGDGGEIQPVLVVNQQMGRAGGWEKHLVLTFLRSCQKGGTTPPSDDIDNNNEFDHLMGTRADSMRKIIDKTRENIRYLMGIKVDSMRNTPFPSFPDPLHLPPT